jgi:hypothetical protein
VDILLAAEPGELALGEAARRLLDLRDGIGEAEVALEMGAEVRVADELERLNVFRHPRGNERADFVEPAGGEHFVDAGVDAGVEGGARRAEADFRDGVAFEGIRTHPRPYLFTHFFTHFIFTHTDIFTQGRISFATCFFTRGGAEDFGDGFAGQQAHLNRADNFLGVARRDAGGGFAVEAREDFVQVLGAMLLCGSQQTLAQFFRACGSVGEAFEERAEVESRAGGEDGELRAEAEIVKREKSVAAVVAGGEDFIGLHEVDQMMRDAFLIAPRVTGYARACRRDFRGADVEAAIDLSRVADQDFAVEAFGERDGESGFAGGGGAEDDDQALGRFGRRGHMIRSAGTHTVIARVSTGGGGRAARQRRGGARRGLVCD